MPRFGCILADRVRIERELGAGGLATVHPALATGSTHGFGCGAGGLAARTVLKRDA
jgi:hypothetical protein